MEEIFDDLICLDEEGESLESSTIMQQTRYSRMRTESCVNHHKKHGDIARCRFSDSKQMASKYCCYGKTSNVIRSDFAANARCSRVERMENPDELIIGTSLLEVDSCEGDDIDCSESGKNSSLDQSSEKGKIRVNVSHANLTSSTALRIYGDDEDWPYLSGDVDEEAVRLAASLEPDTTEEAKDGPQQDPRKKQNATEKMADKWNSQQYCNSDGSSHCGKTSDKLDGSKRLLRKLPPAASPSKERRPVVHARQEPSHHVADSEYPRNRRQELMKCELSERHGRMERISLFMSSQNRRNSLQARTGSPLLYSKKTYVPYPSPWRREETATKLLKRSSGISGVIIKRSYQIKAQSLDNGAKKNRKINRINSVHKTEYNKADSDIVRRKSAMLPPINNTTLPKADEKKVLDEEEYIKVEILNENVQFSKGKTKHEGISKKKLRWILTTEQFQTGGVKANSVEHKDLNDPEAVTGRRGTTVTRRHQNTPKGNPIKLRLPNLPTA